MDTFNTAMSLLQKFVTLAGGGLAGWGLVSIGRSFKDQNGPGVQNGLMELLGGVLLIAAAAIFGSLTM